MHPIFLRIPGLNYSIYSYGAMMVLTFLATQWLSARLAKSRGIDPEIFVNITLIALFTGIVGARASSVLENLGDYTRSDLSAWRNLYNMINPRSGGLTFYGGLILATPFVTWYALHKKLPPRVTMDIIAPCVTLGLGIGRIGCFLGGCCYGAGATVPWAVQFPYYSDAYVDQFYGYNGEHLHHMPPGQLLVITESGVRLRDPASFANEPDTVALAKAERSNPVHPAQLYSTFTSLLQTAILLVYFTLPHTPGRGFPLMLMMEGPSRFLLEMLRVEPPVWGNFSLSMVIGIGLFFVGVVWWIVLGFNGRGKMIATPTMIVA